MCPPRRGPRTLWKNSQGSVSRVPRSQPLTAPHSCCLLLLTGGTGSPCCKAASHERPNSTLKTKLGLSPRIYDSRGIATVKCCENQLLRACQPRPALGAAGISLIGASCCPASSQRFSFLLPHWELMMAPGGAN